MKHLISLANVAFEACFDYTHIAYRKVLDRESVTMDDVRKSYVDLAKFLLCF